MMKLFSIYLLLSHQGAWISFSPFSLLSLLYNFKAYLLNLQHETDCPTKNYHLSMPLSGYCILVKPTD